MRTVYEFSVKERKGGTISLKEFANEVLLIVNTATKCGFTPQYEELEKLYEKYHAQGFEVLDFPCNQFGQQDPGTDDEILDFCHVNYGVTFQMMKKIDVNGENASPIYTFLKEKTKNILGEDIKWNFTKFLISADGKKIKRYAPTVKPSRLEKEIEEMIKDAKPKVHTEELVDHSV